MVIMPLRTVLAHFIRVVHLLLSPLSSRSTCTCIVPLILFDQCHSPASQCITTPPHWERGKDKGPLHTVPQTAFPLHPGRGGPLHPLFLEGLLRGQGRQAVEGGALHRRLACILCVREQRGIDPPSLLPLSVQFICS